MLVALLVLTGLGVAVVVTGLLLVHWWILRSALEDASEDASQRVAIERADVVAYLRRIEVAPPACDAWEAIRQGMHEGASIEREQSP
jgi:hypothetical protein